jgi:hypothetical protein
MVILTTNRGGEVCLETATLTPASSTELKAGPLQLDGRGRCNLYPGDTISFGDATSIYQGFIEREDKILVQTLAIKDGTVEELPPIPLDHIREQFKQGATIGQGFSTSFHHKMLRELEDPNGAEWRYVREGSKYVTIEPIVQEVDGQPQNLERITTFEVLKVELESQYSGAARANLLCHEIIKVKGGDSSTEPISERIYYENSKKVQDFELKKADQILLVDVVTDENKIVLQEMDVRLNESTLKNIDGWAEKADKAVVFLMGSSGNATPEEVAAQMNILRGGFPPDIRLLVMVGNTVMFEEQEDGTYRPKPTLQDAHYRVCNEQEHLHYVGIEICTPEVKSLRINDTTTLVEVGRWSRPGEDGGVVTEVTCHRPIPPTDVASFDLNLEHPEKYTSNAQWHAEGHLAKRVAGALVDEHDFKPPFLIVMGGGSTCQYFIDDFRERGLPIIYYDTSFERPAEIAATATGSVLSQLGSGKLEFREGLDYIVRTPEEQQAAIRQILGVSDPQAADEDFHSFSFSFKPSNYGRPVEPDTVTFEPGMVLTTEKYGRIMILAKEDGDSDALSVARLMPDGKMREIQLNPWELVSSGEVTLDIGVSSFPSFHRSDLEPATSSAVSWWQIREGSILERVDGLDEVVSISPSGASSFHVQVLRFDHVGNPLGLAEEEAQGVIDQSRWNLVRVSQGSPLINQVKVGPEHAEVSQFDLKNVATHLEASGRGITLFAIGPDPDQTGDTSGKFYSEVLSGLNDEELMVIRPGDEHDTRIRDLLADIHLQQGVSIELVSGMEAGVGQARVEFVEGAKRASYESLYLPAAGALKIQQFLQEEHLCQKPILLVAGGGRLAHEAVLLYREQDAVVFYLGDGKGTQVADVYIRGLEDGNIVQREGLDYVVSSPEDLGNALREVVSIGDREFRAKLYPADQYSRQILRPGVAFGELRDDLNKQVVLDVSRVNDQSFYEKAYRVQEISISTSNLTLEVMRLGSYVSADADRELSNRTVEGETPWERVRDHIEAVKSKLPEHHKKPGLAEALTQVDLLIDTLEFQMQGISTGASDGDSAGVVTYPELDRARIRSMVQITSNSNLKPGDPRIPTYGFTAGAITPGLVSSLAQAGATVLSCQKDGKDLGWAVFLDPTLAATRYEMLHDLSLKGRAGHCFFLGGVRPDELVEVGFLDMVAQGASSVTFNVAQENSRSALFQIVSTKGTPVGSHRVDYAPDDEPDAIEPHYNWIVNFFHAPREGSGSRADMLRNAIEMTETLYYRELPGMAWYDEDAAAVAEQLRNQCFSRFNYLSDASELKKLLKENSPQKWLEDTRIEGLLREVLTPDLYEDLEVHVKQQDYEGAARVVSVWTPSRNEVQRGIASLLKRYPEFAQLRELSQKGRST